MGEVNHRLNLPGTSWPASFRAEPEYKIGSGHFIPGTINPDGFNRVASLIPQASRVSEQERNAANGYWPGQNIACGSCKRCRNCSLTLYQSIEQGAFSSIWRTRQHDPEAFTQGLSPRTAEPLSQGPFKTQEPRAKVLWQALDVIFVAEIEHSLNRSREAEELLTPARDRARQFAAGHRHSRAALQFSLRREQISQALGFGKVDPTIRKGSAREFARLRRSQARLPIQSRANCCNHSPAAVQMKFGRIFTRCRAGSRQPEHQGTVEQSAVRIAQRGRHSPPGWRQTAGEMLQG